MKVYVITKGNYSDYHICSVTTDKKKAKLLKEKYSRDYYGQAQIEVYDTDDNEEILRFENIYTCYYYETENEVKVSETDFSYFHQSDLDISKFKDGLFTYVLANNEEDALKIASDKFSKYRAEKMGL